MTARRLGHRSLVALASLACLLAHAPSRAARPMATDDARIVDARACQLETWVRGYRDGGEELWALPGCNPFGGFELTLGGASLRPDDTPRRTVLQGQIKTLLRAVEPDGWGWGIAVGTLNVKRTSIEGRTSPYLYLPLSIALDGERLMLHANVGATRAPAGRRDARATWGVAADYAVTPRAIALAEVYGVDGEGAQAQLGVRIWVVPQRLQLDATIGAQRGADGAGRWVSVGMRMLTPAFLP